MGAINLMIVNNQSLPHSLEAEQASLGVLLLDPISLITILPLLKEEMFYKHSHQKIYAVINDLHNEQTNIDILTICSKLDDRKLLVMAGGKTYISQLTDHAPSMSHAKDYVQIVIDKFLRRKELELANKIAFNANDSEKDYANRLNYMNNQAIQLSQYSTKREVESIAGIADQTIKEIIERQKQGREFLGISTGFDDLNAITSGLQQGNLIILAARPGVGKTSFALQLAANVAAIEEKPSLIFSLEMSQGELMNRLLASFAEIDLNHLKRGLLDGKQIDKLYAIKDYLSTLKLEFFDTSNITLTQIKLEAQKYQIRYGSIGLIVIDYLQLITPRNPKESRVNQVAEISRELKLLAKDLAVPVIAISTLSRAVEARENKRPQLSDLRESGTIEYDSDIVMFLYRDDYYKPESSSNPGEVEVQLAKHRSGPTGRIKLKFEPSFCKFYN
jgi:replicative DNA helicase